MASRYEEDTIGSTTIGFPGAPFNEGLGDTPQLGSGIVFLDDVVGSREVAANASRIEGWRRTPMYRTFQEVNLSLLKCFKRGFLIPGHVLQDFKRSRTTCAIRGFDIHHQLWRLRSVKHMQDTEAELIMRTLVNAVQTYDQVVEVRSCCASFDPALDNFP